MWSGADKYLLKLELMLNLHSTNLSIYKIIITYIIWTLDIVVWDLINNVHVQTMSEQTKSMRQLLGCHTKKIGLVVFCLIPSHDNVSLFPLKAKPGTPNKHVHIIQVKSNGH